MVTKMVAFLLFLLLHLRCSVAQAPSEDRNGNYNYYGRFNPTLAIVIVVIAGTFFFLAFFAIYLRRCSGEDDFAGGFFRGSLRRDGGGSFSRRRGQGLSPEALEKLPRMRFAEAKGLKGVPLECSVCLSEFEDDEEELVRLLPGCGHVFHADCITAWLASHVSCPVCRANVAELADETTTAGEQQASTTIVVDEAEEAEELARLGRQRREARSRSGRRPNAWFPRSHSTGPSTSVNPTAVDEGVDVERVVVADRNQWPSVFLRSLSARLPAWAGRRKGDEEGENSRGGRSAAAGSSSTSFPPSQV